MSFSLFVIFSAIGAVSTNITMLIVLRVLAGGAAASVQAVGAGTIADIWETRERGRAMGIFYLGPMIGPLSAPIIGGALAEHWGWKSTMWFLVIFGGVILVMIFFCLPETLARQQQQQERAVVAPESNRAGAGAGEGGEGASRTRSVQQWAHSVKHFLVDPLRVLAYLRFPPIALTVGLGAVTFGAVFVLNICIEAVFSTPPYSFSEVIVGLLYLPSSMGFTLTAVVGGRWIDHIMAREARRAGRFDANGGLIYLPEDRMRENAWIAVTVYPVALLWFGWAADKGAPWIAAIIANLFFGLSTMLVFGAAATMLTEFMPRRSSAGVAVNNLVRNIFSCVGVIVTQPLIDAMGVGWLCTMVAIATLVSGVGMVWSLRRWGPQWRKEMDLKTRGL